MALGPPDKVAALRERRGERYPFIVRFAGARPDPGRYGIEGGWQAFTTLDLIDAVAGRIEVGCAFALAEEAAVRQVWYLHPDLAAYTIATIAALGFHVRTQSPLSVINLSNGPPVRFWTRTYEAEAPIHAATRAAADAGQVVVVAAGNTGRPDGSADGWINPFGHPDWVICVGAYDAAAARVADFSSRGSLERPETWPDVIAPGVDIVGPYPAGRTKPPRRQRRDEASPAFRAAVPKEAWALYTLESGTSQAAALVSGAAAQVLHYLKSLLGGRTPAAGEPVLELALPAGRIGAYQRARPRLTGETETTAGGGLRCCYRLDAPWRMVKQLLIDTALPVDGAGPHEAGAGLVDPAFIRRQFGSFGAPEITLAASRTIP